MTCTGRVRARWVLPGYGDRVGRGRVLPVPSQLLEGEADTSEAGPVGSCREPEWVGIWLGTPVHPDHHSLRSGPLPPVAVRVPSPGSQTAVQTVKTSEFMTFSVKLVKTAECRPFSSIRPVIVPILKTRSESHLLKFSDFHICGPSLTRN